MANACQHYHPPPSECLGAAWSADETTPNMNHEGEVRGSQPSVVEGESCAKDFVGIGSVLFIFCDEFLEEKDR